MGGSDVFDRTGRRKPTITLEQAKRVSNGLSGELKFWIFQEVIKEDDEFTHEGDEGEFLGFAVGEMGAIRWGQSADCNVRGAR
jgi:hypothetical protein